MVVEYTLEQITTALPMILPVVVTFFFLEAALSLVIGLFIAPKSAGKIMAMWGLTQILLILFIILVYTVPNFTLAIVNMCKYIIA